MNKRIIKKNKIQIRQLTIIVHRSYMVKTKFNVLCNQDLNLQVLDILAFNAYDYLCEKGKTTGCCIFRMF